MNLNNENTILSIGLPVFNGEQFIKKRIESILSQTFQNFELIISNNASEDKTDEICINYVNKDNRIKYFKQETNIGSLKNFKFVLEHAKYDFFVWAAADDIWENKFLEENIKNLLKNNTLVGSISNVTSFGVNDRRTGSKIREFAEKINIIFSKYGSHSIKGTYEEKIRKCIKYNSAQNFYAIFKTKKLQKSFVEENSAVDLSIILKVLEWGDIDVIDQNLLKCRTGGISGKGSIETIIKTYGIKSIIFPQYTFMKWFLKNFGIKLFLKNFDLMFKMNFGTILSIIYDLYLKKF